MILKWNESYKKKRQNTERIFQNWKGTQTFFLPKYPLSKAIIIIISSFLRRSSSSNARSKSSQSKSSRTESSRSKSRSVSSASRRSFCRFLWLFVAIALWGKFRPCWNFNNSLSHERGSERSEQASKRVIAAERASEACSAEQANEWAVRADGRASGPVLMSQIMAVVPHCALSYLLAHITVGRNAVRTPKLRAGPETNSMLMLDMSLYSGKYKISKKDSADSVWADLCRFQTYLSLR